MSPRKIQGSSGAARTAAVLRDRETVPRVGWIAAGSGPGALLVDWPGSPSGPVAARSLVPLDGAALSRAAEERRAVVLLFENGDPRLPLLVGIVQSSTPLLDAVLASRAARPAPSADGEAEARRLLRAKDELVIECGKASITLRRNGKVVIRGTYVETHAAGTNRIKGGAVKIN